MSRNLPFLALLLATGVALAGDVPEAKPASGAAEAQPQKPPAAGEDATSERSRNEQAQDERAKKDEDAKLMSGMSVLGNQEAPKALVIVPWKTSELGRSLGITPMLDDSRQPVDRDVFMRTLSYYEIMSETTRHDGAPAGGRDTAGTETNAAQPATAAHRRRS